MKIWIERLIWTMTACTILIDATSAQDVGAAASGNWNDPTIWTTIAVPGSANSVYIGSTYPAGSATIATVTLTENQSAGNLTLGDGSGTSGILDLGSNTLTVGNAITIGLNGGLGAINEAPGGSFTAATLNIESSNTFIFGASDAVSTLYVYSGSTATTSAVGNVTTNVNVLSGSTLNLGANLNISGQLDVENTGSVLNMNGFNITANTILLGQFGDEAVTLNRGSVPGSLTAGSLYISQGTLDLIAADSIATLLQVDQNSTVTTAATSNVAGGVAVANGGTLNLGANLSVSGSVDIYNGGTLNAHGFNLTSNQLTVGYFGTSAASLTDTGQVTANYFYMGNGSSLTLHGGDVINDSITLVGSSTLSVQQNGGTGLTLNGAFDGALSISSDPDPSHMDLDFNLNNMGPNWDFRWLDPNGSNWVSAIDAMIKSGQIEINLPAQDYSVVDQGGYTYIIGSYSAVPEPSSLVLACIAGASILVGMKWQHGRRRR